jgi:hypothetical protein
MMVEDQGGWLWFLIDVVFVAVLAGAMLYGTVRWRRRYRDNATQQVRDRETLRRYEEG